MNMAKKVLFCSFFALMAAAACAQWSVGARFGGASGLSWKHYNRANTVAFEVLTGFNFDQAIDGIAISPFFEKYESLHIGWSPGGGTSTGIRSARANGCAAFNFGVYLNFTTDSGGL